MGPYQGSVPGASVLVIREGRTLFRRAYGMADLEHHIAATPATNYRLASVTKQFTAAAILLLAQEKRLSLDDPLRKWLPSLTEATAAVTLRHLLTHTSGLIDYEQVMPPDTQRQLHDADVLHLLEGQNRTYFPPGTQYRYSDSGYAFAPAVQTDDPNVAYGFGWRITGESVWHSGESLGFRNVIVRFPSHRFTVIVLTNRNDPEPYTTALAIAKLFIPDADAKRASQVVVGPDSGARPLPR